MSAARPIPVHFGSKAGTRQIIVITGTHCRDQTLPGLILKRFGAILSHVGSAGARVARIAVSGEEARRPFGSSCSPRWKMTVSPETGHTQCYGNRQAKRSFLHHSHALITFPVQRNTVKPGLLSCLPHTVGACVHSDTDSKLSRRSLQTNPGAVSVARAAR
jgi:hypothetical protein